MNRIEQQAQCPLLFSPEVKVNGEIINKNVTCLLEVNYIIRYYR